MTLRHSFLIGRAAAFAVLLISAGATSISVAADAGAARPQSIAGNAQTAELALAAASGGSSRKAQVNANL